jgi:methylglutaconyl-CoA hydratase
MKYTTLDIRVENNVFFCNLNRPDKRNALNIQMLEDLVEVFRSSELNNKIKALVLTGEGKVFSAGADLSMMSDVSGKTREQLKTEAALFYDCFDALYSITLPTICYAHGAVHGGANGLIASCDFCLCESGTRFSFGEVRLGLVPATVAPFILKRTGIMNARKLLLSGKEISAPEAQAMGLADIVCDESQAEDKIHEILGIILGNGPEAVKKTKKLLLDISGHPDRKDLRELCTEIIAEARLSGEAEEGIKAFFDRRKPLWKSTGYS